MSSTLSCLQSQCNAHYVPIAFVLALHCTNAEKQLTGERTSHILVIYKITLNISQFGLQSSVWYSRLWYNIYSTQTISHNATINLWYRFVCIGVSSVQDVRYLGRTGHHCQKLCTRQHKSHTACSLLSS